jgi:antitoxin PrlF
MRSIRELATLKSKRRITLPKSFWQALGLTTGSRVVFELRGGDVVVTCAEADYEKVATGASLDLLEADIRECRNVRALPVKIARAMLSHVGRAQDFDEGIEGEVAL